MTRPISYVVAPTFSGDLLAEEFGCGTAALACRLRFINGISEEPESDDSALIAGP
jgi:hypothetical protein